MYHLFPFHKVERNTSIIIWGAGRVGLEYYQQLKAINYCNVIGIVDSRIKEADRHRYTLDLLKKKYDYIVIAIADRNSVKEVIDQCLSYKIEESKIVSDVSIVEHPTLKKLGQELDVKVWNGIIEAYKEDALGNFDYFLPLIDEIKQLTEKENIKRTAANAMQEMQNEDRVILLRVLLLGECFDEIFMKLYMESISLLNNPELIVCLLYEIVWHEVSHHEYCYAAYYQDRRRLIKRNTEKLLKNVYDDIPFKRKKYKCNSEINKICILRLNLPLYEKSAATRLNVMWANEFVALGYHVKLIAVDLLEAPNVLSFMNFQGHYGKSYQNERYLDSQVDLYFAKGKNIQEKMQDILWNVYRFEPDFIIDTCADYEMLSSILYQYYPIIQIPMRGVNSCTYFHRSVLGSREQFEREWAKYKSIDKSKARFLIRYPRILLQQEYAIGCDRLSHGILENNFVVATVGARVGVEVSNEFVDAVTQFLIKYPNIIWIIAGNGSFPYICEQYEHLLRDGRIRLWGYENDLDTFYGRLNVKLFISPRVSGNGGCAYKALRSGVPVLINEVNGDTEHLIGSSRMIHGGYKELLMEAENLYLNPMRLSDAARISKNLIASLPTAKEYCKKIIEFAKEAIAESF